MKRVAFPIAILLLALWALSATARGQIFVSSYSFNTAIGEYDATTGATVNAALVTGLYNPQGIAVVSTPLPGDYNDNGIVDAADYVVWRKGLGTIYKQNDYNVWRTNFGHPGGSGAGVGANAAVPEPAALLQLLFAAAAWCLRRRISGRI